LKRFRIPDLAGRSILNCFLEASSMKLSVLALLSVVFACASTSAQSFGFASTGGGLYCNYEQLAYAGTGLWGGVDNLSSCGITVNSTLSGFTNSVANNGEQAHGDGVIYGDAIYVALSGNLYAQWTAFTKLKCNSKNKKGRFIGSYGWIGVGAFSGIVTTVHYGYLSCTLPARGDGEIQMRGTTVGTSAGSTVGASRRQKY
jgi:hypothetical protein